MARVQVFKEEKIENSFKAQRRWVLSTNTFLIAYMYILIFENLDWICSDRNQSLMYQRFMTLGYKDKGELIIRDCDKKTNASMIFFLITSLLAKVTQFVNVCPQSISLGRNDVLACTVFPLCSTIPSRVIRSSTLNIYSIFEDIRKIYEGHISWKQL